MSTTRAQLRSWTKLFRAGKDGHRYFREAGERCTSCGCDFSDPSHDVGCKLRGGRIACADNSGGTPDQTDDGILWIDTLRPLRVGISSVTGGLSIDVPLVSARDGGEYYTGDPIEGLPELAKLWGGLPNIELSPAARAQFEILKGVFL